MLEGSRSCSTTSQKGALAWHQVSPLNLPLVFLPTNLIFLEQCNYILQENTYWPQLNIKSIAARQNRTDVRDKFDLKQPSSINAVQAIRSHYKQVMVEMGEEVAQVLTKWLK